VLNTAVETTGRLLAEQQQAKATEALRESDARFRVLVAAGTCIIYRMSPDWRVMHQLDSETLASSSGPIEDWPDRYILEEDRPSVFAAIERAVQTRSLFELEHRVRRADRSIGWVLSRAVPVAGSDNEIVEWFGAVSDVTGRRIGEEKLLESEATLRRNEVWLAAQKEAFQVAMDGGSLKASLGVLTTAMTSQATDGRRCAFYLANSRGDQLTHVVGMPQS
jgi:hypothetical protein